MFSNKFSLLFLTLNLATAMISMAANSPELPPVAIQGIYLDGDFMPGPDRHEYAPPMVSMEVTLEVCNVSYLADAPYQAKREFKVFEVVTKSKSRKDEIEVEIHIDYKDKQPCTYGREQSFSVNLPSGVSKETRVILKNPLLVTDRTTH